MSPLGPVPFGVATRLRAVVSPAAWRARRARRRRIEEVQEERAMERRRRYYCRRALRGLDAAIAELEAEMAATPTGALVVFMDHR